MKWQKLTKFDKKLLGSEKNTFLNGVLETALVQESLPDAVMKRRETASAQTEEKDGLYCFLWSFVFLIWHHCNISFHVFVDNYYSANFLPHQKKKKIRSLVPCNYRKQSNHFAQRFDLANQNQRTWSSWPGCCLSPDPSLSHRKTGHTESHSDALDTEQRKRAITAWPLRADGT